MQAEQTTAPGGASFPRMPVPCSKLNFKAITLTYSESSVAAVKLFPIRLATK